MDHPVARFFLGASEIFVGVGVAIFFAGVFTKYGAKTHGNTASGEEAA